MRLHTHIHTQNGILYSHEKEDPAVLNNWMNLEGIMLRKISQAEKD